MSRSWPRCGGIFQKQLSRMIVLALCLDRSVLVRGTECLLGCTVMAMHPFDEAGLITWEERGACDYHSVGCDVNIATNAATLFDSFCDPTLEGCLWASSSGTDGTSGCACDLCWGGSNGLVDGDHYYMQGYPIWTRIQCLTAALEFQGYDMSACVGQIVDTGTMLCVDEPYEKSMVAATDCDLAEYYGSNIDFWPSCDWGGETRLAAEMFADGLLATTSAAPVSATSDAAMQDSSSTGSSSECLLGCTVMAMHPFDAEGLNTWAARGACDYHSVGCDVNIATNAATLFDSFCDPTLEGCLWASSSGTDGTSGCTCDLCWGGSSGLVDGDHYYMQGYPIWTRIQCLTAALEFQGYDMSACVGQIVDSGTMLCVDEPYEKSMVAATDCDLAEYYGSNIDFWPSCDWGGETRLAAEMFADGLLATTTPATPAPVSALVEPDPVTPVPAVAVTPAPAVADVSFSATSEPTAAVDSSTDRALLTPVPVVTSDSSSTASQTDGGTGTSPWSSSLTSTPEPTTAAESEGEETSVTGTGDSGGGSDDGWSAGAISGLVAFLLLIAGGAGLACKFRNKIHCQNIQCQCCSRP